MEKENFRLSPQDFILAVFTMEFPQAVILYIVGFVSFLSPDVFSAATTTRLSSQQANFLYFFGAMHMACGALLTAKAGLVASYLRHARRLTSDIKALEARLSALDAPALKREALDEQNAPRIVGTPDEDEKTRDVAGGHRKYLHRDHQHKKRSQQSGC